MEGSDKDWEWERKKWDGRIDERWDIGGNKNDGYESENRRMRGDDIGKERDDEWKWLGKDWENVNNGDDGEGRVEGGRKMRG